MLKKLLVFYMATLALAGPSAEAGPPQQHPLWCWRKSIRYAELKGDPKFFFMLGRDSWQTFTTLECTGTQGVTTQNVKVTFESLNTGYGAGHDAIVHLKFLTMWTNKVPFRFRSIITGIFERNLIHWQFTNTEFDVVITVWTANQHNAPKSLEYGILTIEPWDGPLPEGGQ